MNTHPSPADIPDRLGDDRDQYDSEVARTYDCSRQRERHWDREDSFIGQYLKRRHVDDLLDVPVGTGRFFHHYTELRSVTGVDISDDMLAKAREKAALQPRMSVRFEQGNVLALPYRDRAFDTVIVFRLLHLIPEADLDLAIKELCRVCRKDVVVQTYSPRTGIWSPVRSRLSALYSALAARCPHRPRSRSATSSAKPWSHIQAYYHEQHAVDSMFSKHGLSSCSSALLDRYRNTDVRATIYSRDESGLVTES